MKQIWFVIYNLVYYPLLYLIILLSPLLKEKIRISIRDRKNLLGELTKSLLRIDKSKKTIWFHSSSMGEFEQAKPIIEKIKSEKDVNIVISFFSPSGYRNSLKYPYADIITYLPFDTLKMTKKFLDTIDPSIVIFMRYDIWPNIIWHIQKKKIPLFIVNATMRIKSKRNLPIIKNFHKHLYNGVTKILAVSENDKKNFLSFGLKADQIKVVGDTRFDRVYQKSLQAKEKKLFNELVFKDKKVFVLGSTWESDEEVLFPAIIKLFKYDKDLIIIIVPHEPTIIHLEKIENYFLGKYQTIRFSFMNNYAEERIIIIDSIGILLTLYSYADVAYVGGSFKQIHNVLEPAVYGIPVIYGPEFENSQEAVTMKEIGGGIVVKNKREAYKVLRTLFSNENYRKRIGDICRVYVKSNTGATNRITEEIYKYL